MVRSVSVQDIPNAGEADEPIWHPVRHHLGIHAFGVNAWTARKAGDDVIEEHVEAQASPTSHEELYFVATGHAKFIVDGEEVDAPAGTFVFVPDPESKRQGIAVDAGTTVLSFGAAPGEVYTVSDWERRHFPEG
jgi:hypothetical protein